MISLKFNNWTNERMVIILNLKSKMNNIILIDKAYEKRLWHNCFKTCILITILNIRHINHTVYAVNAVIKSIWKMQYYYIHFPMTLCFQCTVLFQISYYDCLFDVYTRLFHSELLHPFILYKRSNGSSNIFFLMVHRFHSSSWPSGEKLKPGLPILLYTYIYIYCVVDI